MGLFDLFKTRDKRLDKLIAEIDNNMANNYKDAAQEAYKELFCLFAEMIEGGDLNTNQISYYSDIIEKYKHKLAGYTHKDQKPYWT